MVSRRNERQQIQFSQNAKYWKTLTIEYPHNAPNLKFIDLLIVNLKNVFMAPPQTDEYYYEFMTRT